MSTKKCAFTWTINNCSFFDVPTQRKSPTFSAVNDDLKWYLEFSTSYVPGFDFRASQSRRKMISMFLYPSCNSALKEYDAISGEVGFSVLKSDSSLVGTKKKKFEIRINGNTQASTSVGFSNFVETTVANSWVSQNQLKISCIVTYKTTEKKKENPNLSSSLSSDLENLLFDEQFSDATINVQGKKYPVYRGILAARSPVFKAMFRSDMQENTTNIVNISDISQEVFEEMLLFIYCGKVKNLEKLVYELLPAANKYDLNELVEMCEDMLAEQLSKDNVIKISILAHMHHAEWLKEEALKFIKLNTRRADIENTKIWDVLSIHPDLLIDIIAVLVDK